MNSSVVSRNCTNVTVSRVGIIAAKIDECRPAEIMAGKHRPFHALDAGCPRLPVIFGADNSRIIAVLGFLAAGRWFVLQQVLKRQVKHALDADHAGRFFVRFRLHPETHS